MKVHAHKMIAKLCEDMANEVFEECMKRDNELWRSIRSSHPELSERALRSKFVNWLAPRLVGDARATLASMLPKISDPVLQNEVYDALLADNVLRRGRSARVQRSGWYKRLTRH